MAMTTTPPTTAMMTMVVCERPPFAAGEVVADAEDEDVFTSEGVLVGVLSSQFDWQPSETRQLRNMSILRKH
jgi:hypothetical protein